MRVPPATKPSPSSGELAHGVLTAHLCHLKVVLFGSFCVLREVATPSAFFGLEHHFAFSVVILLVVRGCHTITERVRSAHLTKVPMPLTQSVCGVVSVCAFACQVTSAIHQYDDGGAQTVVQHVVASSLFFVCLCSMNVDY